MADSTNIKSKNRQSSLDTDLDAMLDEAELTLTPLDNHQVDEDTIDRLLMNAGFVAEEEPAPLVDDTVFSAQFDEFGDDFDLADISIDARTSDAEIVPIDEFKADHDFPLDLIESIAISPDENETKNNFNEDGDEVNLPTASSNTLQHEATDKMEEAPPLTEDTSLTDKLAEFAGFDNTGDFKQPETQENNEIEQVLPTASATSEYNEAIEQTPTPSDSVIEKNDSINDAAESAGINKTVEYDEFGDDFDEDHANSTTWVPLTKTEKSLHSRNETIPDAINNENTIPSAAFDITADIEDINVGDQTDSLPDEAFLQENDVNTTTPEAVADKPIVSQIPKISPVQVGPLIDDAGIAALMQFKSSQESINSNYKKQIVALEAKAKKLTMIAYGVLALLVASLITAVVLGVMAYGTKNEQTRLMERLIALEKNQVSISTNTPHQEHIIDSQLDHKVGETMEPVPTKPVTAADQIKHEPSPSSTGHETENKALESQQDKVDTVETKALPPEKTHAATKPSAHKIPEALTASHQLENQSAGPQKEHIDPPALQPTVSESTATPADTEKNKTPAPPEKKGEAEDHQATPTNVAVKKKTSRTTAQKTTTKKPHKTLSIASNWSVNLIAYKQQWYARSKAAEFSQKGVPVEILPVKSDNVIWYRLRVTGFNDKEEALAYSGRVKKALNLSSVWVGNK